MIFIRLHFIRYVALAHQAIRSACSVKLALIIKCAVFTGLLLSLAGCISTKKADTTELEEDVTQAQSVNDTEASTETTSFTRIPDPRLNLEMPSVSKQAKQEFNKALALMDAGKWQDAEGLLVLLTETYPQLAGPFVNLGITQSALKKDKAAEASWLKAIELNPYNYDAYNALGVFYREHGRFEDAEAQYLKALEHWPHHLPSIKNLGVLYDLYMGRFESALVQYELYQQVEEEENRQIKGWIIDLKRRMASKN